MHLHLSGMQQYMNKYIKHIVVAVALVVSLVSFAAAHAAPMWGAGGSPYLPLVQAEVCGVNGTGCNPSPSAYSTSISNVQPGDNVWIMLYYNNQGTGTATNAKFTLTPQSTGVVNSQTFSGTLTATNTSAVSGAATVNLAQGQTLNYYSTKLYGHNGVLLSSTQGNDLFNGGFNIGDIHDPSDCSNSDTFCHQGVVVVTYKVGTTPIVNQQTCSITNFSANPNSVTSGGSSNITWNTSGCISATVSGGIVYASSLSGSQNTGSLYNTTTYTLTATGSNGSPVSQSVTVSVNQSQACSISYFNASPTYVTSGGSSTLSWGTSGATSVTLSGGNTYGSQSTSGSISTGSIYGSQTYTLTANCQNGQSQTQTITISANQQQACYVTSFYASPAIVTSGSSTTLYWNTSGANSVYISGLNNYSSNQQASGSATTGAIYGTQTYTLTASCQSGTSQTQTITVSTSQPAQTLAVYTGAPTNVTQTSARLNGILTQSGGYNTQVYFQWGTSSAYGFTTSAQSAGASTVSVPFFDTPTNLSANTTYYYRAVATNSSGTVYGNMESFSTPSVNVYVPPTVVTVVQGVGSGSDLVSLEVNSNQPINACVGNMVTYLVHYKNISGHELDNAVLQVLLPQDVEFQSTTPGIYNASDHTITFSIGTLTKDQEGTMTVTGVVSRSALNRTLIVASATIAFTNPRNSSQESAVAYGLGNTNNCANSLAGLALFGNGFWPTTLIGWLVLILVLLLLIYLATVLYRNSRRNMVVAGRPAGMGPRQQAPHYEDMDVPTYTSH
jgi:hypothetical protein